MGPRYSSRDHSPLPRAVEHGGGFESSFSNSSPPILLASVVSECRCAGCCAVAATVGATAAIACNGNAPQTHFRRCQSALPPPRPRCCRRRAESYQDRRLGLESAVRHPAAVIRPTASQAMYAEKSRLVEWSRGPAGSAARSPLRSQRSFRGNRWRVCHSQSPLTPRLSDLDQQLQSRQLTAKTPVWQSSQASKWGPQARGRGEASFKVKQPVIRSRIDIAEQRQVRNHHSRGTTLVHTDGVVVQFRDRLPYQGLDCRCLASRSIPELFQFT